MKGSTSTLLGTNFGDTNVTTAALVDITAAYIDLVSRGPAPFTASLNGVTVTPGVWATTIGYTLDPGSSVTFDALGDPAAVFIMTNTGEAVLRFIIYNEGCS